MTAGQYEGHVCEYVLMCSGGGWWGNDRGGPERGHKACVLILSPEDLHTHTHKHVMYLQKASITSLRVWLPLEIVFLSLLLFLVVFLFSKCRYLIHTEWSTPLLYPLLVITQWETETVFWFFLSLSQSHSDYLLDCNATHRHTHRHQPMDTDTPSLGFLTW